jgi:hypothetical protein
MTSIHYRPPEPPSVSRQCVAENWRRFKEQWENHEIATDLQEASHEKRAAVFVTCIATDAYGVFWSFEFASAADKKKINLIMTAFENYYIGAVSVTYERYVFNRRTQDNGERFEAFPGEIRRIVSIRQRGRIDDPRQTRRRSSDDATRHKLLQMRDLTLKSAIDTCRASEAARVSSRQWCHRRWKCMRRRKMKETEPTISALWAVEKPRLYSRRRHDSSRPRDRDEPGRKYNFCDGQHVFRKDLCPAYGKTCRKCNKKIISTSSAIRVTGFREIDDDCEEALTLTSSVTDRSRRLYTRMKILGRSVRFMLDCGAPVNLIPEARVKEVGLLSEMRPPESRLRLHDDTPLKTAGMITLPVDRLKKGTKHFLDFYVTANKDKPILGAKTCLDLDLVRPFYENISAVQPGRTTCITKKKFWMNMPTYLRASDVWKELYILTLTSLCGLYSCHFAGWPSSTGQGRRRAQTSGTKWHHYAD